MIKFITNYKIETTFVIISFLLICSSGYFAYCLTKAINIKQKEIEVILENTEASEKCSIILQEAINSGKVVVYEYNSTSAIPILKYTKEIHQK